VQLLKITWGVKWEAVGGAPHRPGRVVERDPCAGAPNRHPKENLSSFSFENEVAVAEPWFQINTVTVSEQGTARRGRFLV
jgi:hypothetical protein